MYIKIDATILAKYLKNTAYIVSKFKEESSLACVHLKTKEDGLVLILNGDTDKAVITLPCSIVEQGECYVTANKFIGLMQSFTGEIELIQIDKGLSVKQDKIKINLPLIKDCPLDTSFTKMQFDNEFTLDGDVLDSMIGVVSPFIDKTSKTILGGINLQLKNGAIKARTCHNAAMAMSVFKCRAEEDHSFEATLKVETLQAISKIFAEDEITISSNESVIRFASEDCMIYTRTLSGKYPPIESAIEKEEACDLTINSQVLDKCLRRILIVKTLDKRINLQVKEDKVIVSYGKLLTEELPIEKSGEDINLAVNYEYLLDVLRVMNGAKTQIKITPAKKLKFVDKNNIVIVCPLC